MPSRRSLLLLASLAVLGVAPARAAAADYAPGHVVVQPAPASPGAVAPPAHTVPVPAGTSIHAFARKLDARPGVRAVPDYIAHAAGFFPRDPGRGTGWADLQWNFVSAFGIRAVPAWRHLLRAGRPGGRGVVVAVVDTGVAYRDLGRWHRSPDFVRTRFVPGWDFVGHDPYPVDQYGHGTFVAGTIAEQTDNDVGVTGLAYGASIMPVRVLGANGDGQAATIARGIRWATDHGADIINLSLEFGVGTSSIDIPEITSALRYAHVHHVIIVGAAGNQRRRGVRPRIVEPARNDNVVSVGATTRDGCLAWYSSSGVGLDLVAPGGGNDAALDDPHCHPNRRSLPPIYQMTFGPCSRRHAPRGGCSPRNFYLPGTYRGTSMAAPHVSAAAALVIASGVVGPHPSPAAVIRRLEHTARDLGPKGRDTTYGYGLLDAGAATAPR